MALKTSINIDNVLNSLRNEIFSKMKPCKVNVGVKDGDSVEAAFVAEFGAPHVPPRPFITASIIKNRNNYREIVENKYGSFLSGKCKIDSLLDDIGVTAVDDIHQYMMMLQTPKNSPVTQQIKGYDNPLITDDLRLYDSVMYEVIK